MHFRNPERRERNALQICRQNHDARSRRPSSTKAGRALYLAWRSLTQGEFSLLRIFNDQPGKEAELRPKALGVLTLSQFKRWRPLPVQIKSRNFSIEFDVVEIAVQPVWNKWTGRTWSTAWASVNLPVRAPSRKPRTDSFNDIMLLGDLNPIARNQRPLVFIWSPWEIPNWT